jgi:perosamine synthetase
MRPWVGAEEAAAAADAVASGWLAQGPRVAAFEAAFAAAVGAADAVATSSCTAALHLALVVSGIGPGDDVVVPSLSFVATANAVRHAGARPVFADVDPATLALTADTVEAACTRATRAVILVHQAGTPADIDAVRAVCDRRGITVVEDAACALGATYRGARIGTGSPLVAFSFHPRKVITCGEGGMVATRDPAVAARLRRLREHGMDVSAADRHRAAAPVIERYLETGFNYRMTDVQAAVGLVQLGKLDAIVRRRRLLAERYRAALAPLGVVCAADPPWGTTTYQSFWTMLPAGLDQGALLRDLHARGVSARRGIMAAHLEPAYAGAAHVPLPVTEGVTGRSVILPMFHTMTDAEQAEVTGALFDLCTAAA